MYSTPTPIYIVTSNKMRKGWGDGEGGVVVVVVVVGGGGVKIAAHLAVGSFKADMWIRRVAACNCLIQL